MRPRRKLVVVVVVVGITALSAKIEYEEERKKGRMNGRKEMKLGR
jgi:hypothetical protein